MTNKAIDPENTPAIFAAASIKSLSTAVIGIGLLVYVKKHKRKAESQMKKTALALAFLLLFSFALAAVQLTSPFAVRFAGVKAAASPRTIIFPDDHPTIQAAIDDASEGDTIFVRKGVYVENPVVNKSVSLIGEDRNLTVIDVTAGLKVQSNNVTIAGFAIYDGYDGISLATNYCNISGNKITNTTHGIVVFGYENSIL